MRCWRTCLLAALLAAGCTSEEEEKAVAQATAFAEDYFNLRFDEAFARCTPDSRKWIAFRASNITERDLETLRAAGEDAYVGSARCERMDDSTAVVRCVVCEALLAAVYYIWFYEKYDRRGGRHGDTDAPGES